MGECIYVRDGEAGPEVRQMPSEVWMRPAGAGELLAKGHFLNTTLGVWFYEHDLWDKEALRRRLLALVDHVTAPEFLRRYEEWGQQFRKAPGGG
ncbi:MAG: hypothetical protein HY699_09200 [Deltaproteobacteria bacterium]|nr:hypothetical protein [Deltaproteobacteria bacterium]